MLDIKFVETDTDPVVGPPDASRPMAEALLGQGRFYHGRVRDVTLPWAVVAMAYVAPSPLTRQWGCSFADTACALMTGRAF